VNEPLDILAVFAHPDDAELLVGGSLARSVDRGERVGILDLTAGEMGSRGTVEIRAREAREAAEVLGVAVRRNAGFPDTGVDDSHESRRKLASLLREMKPTLIVTHWIEGRHPDHVATARLVLSAAFLAGLKNYPASGDAFRPKKVVHSTLYREDGPAPSFVIDVTPQLDRKLRALACYRSQFEGAKAAGEMLGGGRPFADQVQAHLAYWGSRIRAPYGEPFWTRETLAADSLGQLAVSTF
jgi:bacillithiol biosynthesis deacetylase BshB1